MLPDWDEDDEEDEDNLHEVETATQYGRAEDFLVAWDPSMYSDEEWDLWFEVWLQGVMGFVQHTGMQ